MISRRSLFGLIPAPFAAGLGLLTTSPEPTPAPDSDELAEAALAVEDELLSFANIAPLFARMRANAAKPGPHHLSLHEVDDFERRQIAYQQEHINAAETLLRQRLAGSRGVSVVIEGRVYTAGRATRGNHLVEPVWVAMLTPAEGGNS